MLQRIQSIFLLLAGLVIAALFFFPLVHGVYVNGQHVDVMITGVYRNSDGNHFNIEPFTVLTIATAFVALLPIAIIFMYNNRKNQIMACYGAIVLFIAYGYWVAQAVKVAIGGTYINTNNYGIGIILLSVSIILIILAQKAIQRDEKLVRSADRLR